MVLACGLLGTAAEAAILSVQRVQAIGAPAEITPGVLQRDQHAFAFFEGVHDWPFARGNRIDAAAPGTLYPFQCQFNNAWDLELGDETSGADSFEMSAGRKTLYFSVRTANNADQLRILTEIPEPATWMLTGAVPLVAGIGRRRS